MMVREIIVSVTAHMIVFGGLFFQTSHDIKPPVIKVVHQISAVSPQQVQQLMKQAPSTKQQVSKTPQVQVKPDEVIPKRTRRKKQAAKQTAPAENKKSSGKKKGSKIKGIKTDTEFEHPDYLMEMRDRIFENWRYPQLQQSVMTTVYFRIARDGKVISLKVEKPTGHVRFDRSAWEAVQKSNPFNPLPEEFKEKELGIHFNFYFDYR